MLKKRNIWKNLGFMVLAAMAALTLAGCNNSSSSPPIVPVEPIAPTVLVTDTAGVVVEGATVYAIPAADVAAISAVPLALAAGTYDDTSLTVDEPLEDLVNGNFAATIGVANYVTGITDATGKAVLTGLPVADTDKYFIYVAPADTDTDHLPGGSLCRNAVTGASLDNKVTSVEVSTTPSATATYIGSSACLTCHTGKIDQQKTAHKHGIMATGTPSGLQNLDKFNADDGIYNYMAGVDMFTPAGTTVFFYDYDSTRGFDKFKTSMTDPTIADPTAVVWATVRVYKDATDSKYKMEFTNVINSADSSSPMIREAMMTYGGGVYKQRYLTSFGDSKSLYVLPLQFQAAGDDTNTDRTRKQYRDYHLDFWLTIDATTPSNTVLKSLPAASKNFDINCASCHFTGFNVVAGTAVDGEHVASAVEDINGTVHPLTGVKQELNVGCETCHGPGSEHQAAGGNGLSIVTPGFLSASREAVICGQCHARAKGNDSFEAHTDATLNLSDKMMKPGTSRADYLANNTSRHDATTSNFWADGLHSKSHHQQYTDFIKSSMYRNSSELMTCTSCHDVHTPGTDRHQLNGASDNTLCLSCHASVVSGPHQEAKTGSSLHSGAPAKCIECHNVKTAKSGAGASNPLNGGDISSHVFDVPLAATDAMPIPHNNTCGGCHN
ncbi:MAG: hypothetical protein GW833_01715 [Desulfuromonadales bacterium]|nr:hypothetical protein [Desulfuromonadales bacterium]